VVAQRQELCNRALQRHRQALQRRRWRQRQRHATHSRGGHFVDQLRQFGRRGNVLKQVRLEPLELRSLHRH
jgi:hypothetical protein